MFKTSFRHITDDAVLSTYCEPWCVCVCVCLSVDLWAGQQLSEAVAAGICLQEEGGRDDERHREERQHLGSTHLPEGPGTQSQHSYNSCYVTVRLSAVCPGLFSTRTERY